MGSTSRPAYSQLRSGQRISLVDASPLPAPMAIYVEPTNICNFKCVYCPESFPDFEERTGGLHRLDLAAFERVAGQIVELGRLKVLNFYMMGEPLANRALPDSIRTAVELGVADRTSLTTNATLLDERSADRLIESGLNYLRVSIYGGTEEAHARRTGSRIKLARIVENVRAFRARRETRGATSPVVYVKMIDSGDSVENEGAPGLGGGAASRVPPHAPAGRAGTAAGMRPVHLSLYDAGQPRRAVAGDLPGALQRKAGRRMNRRLAALDRNARC